MRFRKTKTGVPRTVPLHAYLIEQGFEVELKCTETAQR